MTAQRRQIRIAQFGALAIALPVLLLAFISGPDAGVSGVPEEDTCSDCHRGPSGGGNVTVTFPGTNTYSPGAKQHLVVTVTDSTAVRWGFQLTARLSNNPAAQAGSFTAGADGYTQLVCTQANFRSQVFGNACSTNGFALQYIEHTQAGTRMGTKGPVTYEFDWTPPANVGNVTVYVSSTGANGDNTSAGDHVYNARYVLTPAGGGPPQPPAISSVVNGASFQSDVSAGSWVTILGTGLASGARSWTAADFNGSALPTRLDGVSVKINGQAAYVAYISPTQINVQAPADAALGPVAVEAAINGITSPPATAQLQPASPAFFLWNGKYVVATRPDFSRIGPPELIEGVTTTPAKPGDTIILWGTGFGPTNPAVPPGVIPPASPVANATSTITVTIGNTPATVIGAAIAPGNAGLYQVAIQVPGTIADGDYPVAAQVSGMQSPTGLLVVKR